MLPRIKKLTELTLKGETFVATVTTEFDRKDFFLSESERDVKRICEYILNQKPMITEYSALTGFFRFDGSVVGDAFGRSGHRNTMDLMREFYLKPIDNISTCEWQHATADYKRVLDKGIKGIIADIDKSLKNHSKAEEIEFLNVLKKVANTLVLWAHKCSKEVLKFSEVVKSDESKERLKKLSDTLLKVPENAPETFYEAVLTVYICYSADPDSIGTADRYLTRFYKNDIKRGIISEEEAKAYLQELFLMLQSKVKPDESCFTRGGESHFCIGGYLPNGEDAFDETSKLIIDSLMELPTYIPQVTLRWTKKTPKEVFKYVMDCERKDEHKRIAFTNDEQRIKAYTQICGYSFEQAVTYTTVGCNEPAFCGAITGSNSKINTARCIATLFHEKKEDIINSKTFDEFYSAFERELIADFDLAYYYDDMYNTVRAKDINYISSLFFNGPIENAKSLTQGGCDVVMVSPMAIGITNVIDSLCVVKQFVFDEKNVTMSELINAVNANWKGYEDLHTVIIKNGKFFGNDDALSNEMAEKYYNSLYEHFKDRTNLFGYHILLGDLLGYNDHHKWFGEHTKATPDGRYDGDLLKFGIDQSEGKDKNGLTALLNSVAKANKNLFGCGCTVTNVSIDEQLMKNDDAFEKTVDMFETYFKNGGVHFQLTYVSPEDLKNARIKPEEYKNLRVRVTGFSEYYVKLSDGLQEDILKRTQQH